VRCGFRLTALRAAAASRVDLRDRGRGHATPAAGGKVDLMQLSKMVAEVRVKLEGNVR
jgi:hypothetical protein